jgi:hypothetical protein
MNSSRLALGATLATTFFWTAKAVAIGIAGGLDRSPLESPLFLLGLVCCLVASAATGVALARRPTMWGRALAAAGGTAVGVLVTIAASAVVSAAAPPSPGWVWGELNLWAMALTLLVVNLTLVARRSQPERRPAQVSSAYGA